MNKNKFADWFKKHWKKLLLGLLAMALLAGNICVLLFVNCENNKSAWLTLFSGWVSGIATIVLGIIAVVQSKIHKDENDKFLSEQQKINSQLMQEQYNLSWRKNQYDVYNAYRMEFFEFEKEFAKYTLAEILAQTLGNNDRSRALADWSILVQRIKNDINRSVAYLIECKFYCEVKVNLFNLLVEYFDKLDQFYPLLQQAIKDMNVLSDTKTEHFVKLKEMGEIRKKIDMSYFEITACIGGLIRQIFEEDIETAKSIIDENIDDHNNWLKKIGDGQNAE